MRILVLLDGIRRLTRSLDPWKSTSDHLLSEFMTRDTRSFRPPDGVTLIGVDEETAIVGGVETFTVMGKGSAWVFEDNGLQQYRANETIELVK